MQVDGNEDTGWFDVDAYKTKETWEGPDLAEDSVEGFETLEGAIAVANSPEFADCYEVTVRAYGQHQDYEAGETVYWRFKREDPAELEAAKALGFDSVAAMTDHKNWLAKHGSREYLAWVANIVGTKDPLERYVSSARQQELIGLADAGAGANAVRLAIREAVEAVRSGIPAAPAQG